ncbi:fk506-binding 2 precursor [Fusarium pseudocircinatum]|uniref:Fk506-binding 2 n=1 Tax=Fusarium pseudocircinatum TaxID=56676 RepID=A0A8H5LBE1_9HYPO|nr:fk506-binding 2 precursor [Fusarium pseudocircinatum]
MSVSASVQALVTVTSSTSTSSQTPTQDSISTHCHLDSSFAFLIQGGLGFLALLTLVYKRWHERPQRALKVWLFDVSKQVVGSLLLHILNVLMSVLPGGLDVTKPTSSRVEVNEPSPCASYLLHIALDTTIGIPMVIIFQNLLAKIAQLTPFGQPPESIQSGYYGNPPDIKWWLKQSTIYFTALVGMKISVFVILITLPWIVSVGDWTLTWMNGNQELEIVFVMMVFPLTMNAMQYYIIDSFIKNQTEHLLLPSAESEMDSRGRN